jgi:hypothetical protein
MISSGAVRVFKPILGIQLRAWLTMKVHGPKAGPKWLTASSLVNQSPFDHVTVYKTRAST